MKRHGVETAFDLKNWEQQHQVMEQEERWDDALVLLRRVVDERQDSPLWQLVKVMKHVEPDVVQLLQENTGSSWYLLGIMLYYGVGGVQQDKQEAYPCFSTGAELNHSMCMYWQGIMLMHRRGDVQDAAAGYRLQVRAAELGCRSAFSSAGRAYQYGRGKKQSYRKAAQWYLKGGEESEERLSEMLQEHPMECCPFGEWRPELQPLVPAVVTQAQRTSLLLCRSCSVPRDIAMRVVAYVCTEGEEWEKMLRKPKNSQIIMDPESLDQHAEPESRCCAIS